MKYIRPFIVLHSVLENDKTNYIIVYVDAIETIQPFENEDVSGSTIQVGSAFYSVFEKPENILRMIANVERGKNDKDN